MKRDYHGFAQFNSGDGWKFYVSGFDSTCSGQSGQCTVVRSDDTKAWVPIDAEDRITIAGRKFGRRFWTH